MSKQRLELSKHLRMLVTGRMTNDSFDDMYYDEYSDSKDPGVREIARFGWTLYSSDLPYSYCLKGKNALPGALKKRAAHAILFLQTEQEYEYPQIKDTIWQCCVAVLLAPIILGLLLSSAWNSSATSIAFLLFVVLCIVVRSGESIIEDKGIDLQLDSSIWPFADTGSLAIANSNSYLLGGFTEYETS